MQYAVGPNKEALMPSTFSTNKTFEMPANGSYVDDWNIPLNAVIDEIDTCFGGSAPISVTGLGAGSEEFTLAQYQPPNIEFTGVLSGNLVYFLPTGIGGVWTVSNATTGAYTLGFGILGGNTFTLPQGQRSQLVSDGASVALTQTQPSYSAPFPITSLETSAGVTVYNTQYSNAPYDIRRYSASNNFGLALDDSPTWAAAANVISYGGSVYVPPVQTMIKSPANGGTAFSFTAPLYKRVSLAGEGCTVYTTGAIYAMNVTGGFMGGMTIAGFTFNNSTDSLSLGAINCAGAQNTIIQDCWLDQPTASAPSAAYSGITLQPSDPTNDNTGCQFTKIYRFGVRQPTGNDANYVHFGVLIFGACNQTEIYGCNFSSTNYHVGIYNQTSLGATGSLANGVWIHGNAHENSQTDSQQVYAVIVNGNNLNTGTPGANNHIEGLIIGEGQRYEALTGGVLLLQGLNNDSSWPTYIAPPFSVSDVTNLITQNNVAALQVTVNTWVPSITPSWGGAGINTTMASNGPFIFKNTGQASVNEDAGVFQTPGIGGVSVKLGSLTNFAARNKAGGGGTVDLPNGGAYRISGVQVLGSAISGYGTPIGGAHQPSFTASTINLGNLAAAVAQLIVDLETQGIIST